jgi:hypothetical protein
MNPIDPNSVYSPDEAAEILGVSRGDVSVLIRDRILIESGDREGRRGISGHSLLSELQFRENAPWWRRAARTLRHSLP